jgi:hypothetical protein
MPPGTLFRRVLAEHGEELRKDTSIAASACSGATIVVALRAPKHLLVLRVRAADQDRNADMSPWPLVDRGARRDGSRQGHHDQPARAMRAEVSTLAYNASP